MKMQKIRQWWRRHKPDHMNNYTRGYQDGERAGQDMYRGKEILTREQVLKLMAEVKAVAYNDGMRDGLAVAREQATKSLKEILWRQNNQ